MSETLRIVQELREHDHPQSQFPVRSDGTPIVRVAADAIDELYEALAALIPILEAVRYTAGLGKNQMARVEKAKAALARARGETEDAARIRKGIG